MLPGSRLRQIYGVAGAEETYFCNYDVYQAYVRAFEASGLIIAAVGPEGQVRAVELHDHPFFIATLFHPQLASQPGRPHPFINAFVQAALGNAKSSVA